MPRLTPEAERVLGPLIRRAARFGPYTWLEWAAIVGSAQTVQAATGSFWLSMAWIAPACILLDSGAANREHVIEKWLREEP